MCWSYGGPAISNAIGPGSDVGFRHLGVFVWREFANAPSDSRRLIPFIFLCFVAGLAAIGVAAVIRSRESKQRVDSQRGNRSSTIGNST
jgi:hypothetical protein